MWRPRVLGDVIAERTFRFERPRRTRPARVTVRFGRPVRAPAPERGDPWWCPVQIAGLGKRRLERVAGEDSLQALTLALEYVRRVLPMEAGRGGGRLEWLGTREDLVFSNTFLLALVERGLQNCIEGLGDAVDILEKNRAGDPAATRALVTRLRALIASGGQAGDSGRGDRESS